MGRSLSKTSRSPEHKDTVDNAAVVQPGWQGRLLRAAPRTGQSQCGTWPGHRLKNGWCPVGHRGEIQSECVHRRQDAGHGWGGETVRLWALAGKDTKERVKIDAPAYAYVVALAPNGKLLASRGPQHQSARLWHLEADGRPTGEL